MGRIRSIKPEFFQHEVLFDLERDSGLPLRLSFAGLWTQCDREGRFKWRPRTLKAAILPFDEIDFSRVLDALTTRGFLVKYEVSGEDYGYVPSWKQHQFVNGKENQSSIPNPPKNQLDDANLTRGSRVDDALTTDGVKERKGKEGKGREGGLATRPCGEPFNSQEVSVIVCQELRISGDFDIQAIERAIQSEHLDTKEPPQAVGDRMVAARKAFDAIPLADRKFDWPVTAFFNKDIWRHESAWRKAAKPEAQPFISVSEQTRRLRERK